jgi:hypothetical protein
MGEVASCAALRDQFDGFLECSGERLVERSHPMSTVLFVCLQNAGRSQMSQALFEEIAAARHHAISAGTRPAAQVHPEVVEAMREIGIDLSGSFPASATSTGNSRTQPASPWKPCARPAKRSPIAPGGCWPNSMRMVPGRRHPEIPVKLR